MALNVFSICNELYKKYGNRLSSCGKEYYICQISDNIWVRCNSKTYFQIKLEQEGMLDNNLKDYYKRRIVRGLEDLISKSKPKPIRSIISIKGGYVFDILKKNLRKRKIEDFCESTLPIKYNPQAVTTPFLKFLDDVLGKQKNRFIKFMVSVLRRENTTGFFITGQYAGVSMLIDCIRQTFKDYFLIMNNSNNSRIILNDTYGGFIFRDHSDTLERFSVSKILQDWTPIYVGSYNENMQTIQYFLKAHRDVDVFKFDTVFVDNPSKPNEKKINRQISKVLLSNREGILKVFLDAMMLN